VELLRPDLRRQVVVGSTARTEPTLEPVGAGAPVGHGADRLRVGRAPPAARPDAAIIFAWWDDIEPVSGYAGCPS
jgi:hypothetical protein